MKNFFAIIELRTKIVSLSSLIIGFLLCYFEKGTLDISSSIILALCAISFDMATSALNSFMDYMRKSDRQADNFEKDKVIVHKGVAPGIALLYAIFLYGIGLIFGIILIFNFGIIILIWGLIGFLTGVFYNIGPSPISHTPLGEVFAGGILGSLLLGLAYWVSGGQNPETIYLLIIGHGIMIAHILTVNNSCDFDADKISGRKTLSILLGKKGSIVLLLLQKISVSILYFFYFEKSLGGIISIIVFTIVSLILFFIHLKIGFSAKTKGKSMKLVLLQTILELLCLIIALGITR